MHPEPWTYKSLHDYLDDLFRNRTPDTEEIIQAKKTYWRSYNTRLKQTQRRKHKEITLSLTKEELELLRRRLQAKQSVSAYIKKLLQDHLEDTSLLQNNTIDKQALNQIEQQLFLLIDYLESLIYQRRFVDQHQIGKLEQHILYLQQLLETQF
ncbi:MAG: hypothetical protein QM564_06670 [Bergeyella sp.]